MPNGFDLQDAFTGVKRVVETVWRQYPRMGVRFVGRAKGRPMPRKVGFGRRQS